MTANPAAALLDAQAARRQIAPSAGLTMPQAYRIAAEIRDLRLARGERIVGRKIGFTNRTIWDEYGVHAPIWGYVYDRTLPDPRRRPRGAGELRDRAVAQRRDRGSRPGGQRARRAAARARASGRSAETRSRPSAAGEGRDTHHRHADARVPHRRWRSLDDR